MHGLPLNTILHCDCLTLLPQLPRRSINFVLTNPPYGMRYRSRDGRHVPNDHNLTWLNPAFAEIYDALERNAFCVSFYGWADADLFLDAWRSASRLKQKYPRRNNGPPSLMRVSGVNPAPQPLGLSPACRRVFGLQ